MKSNILSLINKLNRQTWVSLTSKDVNEQSPSEGIIACLDGLRINGYSIIMGSSNYNYSIGELRAIEKLIAWISQILYAESLIQNEIEVYGEEAELEMYEEMIKDAEKGLLVYRDIHPDGISFFLIEGQSIILKCCPYFLMDERIMIKTGLIIVDPTIEGDLDL
jgi:hypothetical protein